jgi:hypothetical protein
VNSTRRALDYVSVAALLSAAVLKWIVKYPAELPLLITLAVCALRSLITFIDVLSRKVPWGRLVLPVIITAELARVAAGAASRLQVNITLVVLELGLIAATVVFVISRWHEFRSVPHLEDVFEKVFSQFLPDRVSAMAARELVLLWSGLAWLLRGFRLRPEPGFGYIEESFIRYLPVLIPMLLVTEGLVYEILLHTHSVLRVVLHVFESWAILWAFGMYAIMKSRPHQLTGDRVLLRCGFASCQFHPANVLQVERRPEDAPRPKDTARLTAKGAPALEIRLKEPVVVRSTFGGSRSFDRIAVSADDPAAFTNALLALQQTRA